MRNAWLGLSMLVVVLDFFSKQFAQTHLVLHEPWVIFPFFNFTLVYNTGAAFGLFSSVDPAWERWALSAISLLATGFFVHWFYGTKNNLQRLAIALIIGGALGNFIDRAFYGYVIDFVQLHAGEYYFAAFNLADSAISVGVALLLFYWVKYERHH